MSTCQFELLYFKWHFPNSSSTIFKPHRISAQITIQVILFAVWLKQLSLSQEIIMCLHFIIHVNFILIFNEFALTMTWSLFIQTFCHIRRNTYEVLVWTSLLHLFWSILAYNLSWVLTELTWTCLISSWLILVRCWMSCWRQTNINRELTASKLSWLDL